MISGPEEESASRRNEASQSQLKPSGPDLESTAQAEGLGEKVDANKSAEKDWVLPEPKGASEEEYFYYDI